MIERASPEKVSTELIIRMSILLDHLPTNFDVAFKRALETLEINPEEHAAFNESDKKHPVMDDKKENRRSSKQDEVLGK